MPTSPTSQSATHSGAAKDDVVGLHGDFKFAIADLLANDPGGAAKVDITKQFFFGDTAYDQNHQAAYLKDHGITDNGDGSYTLGADATDFNYFVQMGNKGTWSEAHVDVTAPVPQLGGSLFTENFDHDTIDTFQSSGVDTSASIDLVKEGWTGTGHNDNFGFTTVSEVVGNGKLGGIESTSGDYWLDTQNTPGGIDISHTFTDSTAAVGDKTSVLSFDIAKMNIEWDGLPYQTDQNASFSFKIDGEVVKEIHASDLETPNQMQRFDIDLGSYANAGFTHTLELHDTSPAGYFGFAVDSIQIRDWIV